MKNIITISRETGSGGHTIGQLLAKRLGYDFYDKEIVDELAKELNVQKENVENKGEFMDDKMEIDLVSGIFSYNIFSRKEKVPFDKINKFQEKLINDIASKGKCVIVGRNADYILKDNKDAFHIFIHADMEHRVARVLLHEMQDNTEKEENDSMMYGNVCVDFKTDKSKSAIENRVYHELEIKDKTRATHYNYFTNRIWGMVSNYNLMIDTGLMTQTQCVELIEETLKKVNGGLK